MVYNLCGNLVSCSKYSLLKVIVYSSIDIVDKGKPCLVINRNNTWFLVMCELHYTCIHVEYNYSLHDLDVELSFSWCFIMLITKTTTTKNEIWQTTKIFFTGGEFVLWFWWNSLSKGEKFSTYTHHIFTQFFFCVLGMCFVHIFFGSFVDSAFSLFLFKTLKIWKLSEYVCQSMFGVYVMLPMFFIKGEIVKSCVMCNIGKC